MGLPANTDIRGALRAQHARLPPSESPVTRPGRGQPDSVQLRRKMLKEAVTLPVMQHRGAEPSFQPRH
jgi:hypothetical protein